MARALLLAGGTALGADQIYPMERLLALHGIGKYKHVAGVSVGSVNGSMFAANKMPELRTIWEHIDGITSFMCPRILGAGLPGWLCPPGLMSLKPLRKKLKNNITRAEILPHIEFTVGVTDFQRDEYLDLVGTEFSTDKEFIDAILASCAQPVLMQGERVRVYAPPARRHWCYDGGVKHIVPYVVDPLSFEHIDVILCNPPLRLPELSRQKLESLLDVGLRAFNIMANMNVLIADVLRLHAWQQDGANITIYAPIEPDDEFDASNSKVVHRLKTVGPWMWNHPWTVDGFLQHWMNS